MDLSSVSRFLKPLQVTSRCPRHFILVEWSGETSRTHDELMDWFHLYLVRHYPPVDRILDDNVQRLTRNGFVITGHSDSGIAHVVRNAVEAWERDGHTEKPVVVPLNFNGQYMYP